MKTLVVYYSKTGVTRKAAVAISRMLGSDIEEIVDLKERRGIMGWLTGGRDSTLKNLTDIKRPKKDPSKYNYVVIGTPVWAWTVTPAVRTYITKRCRHLKKVAFFCTNDGSPGNTFKEMQVVCKKKPLAALSLSKKDMRSGEYFEKIRKFVSKIKK
jgi:menaquinone-dependent protoporphyrinogen IX oxidase